MKQVLVSSTMLFNQVAILEEGKLIDYLYELNDNQNLVSNIYKGRVVNILPGMEAAFVDIGLEKNAYLFLNDLLSDKFLIEKGLKKKNINSISKVLKKGDEVMVQVVREPIGEKNVSVTTDISLTGKYIAFIPNTMNVNISKRIRNLDERNRLEEIGKTIMANGNGMIIRTFARGCSRETLEKEYAMLSALYSQIEKEFQYSYAPKLLRKSNSLIESLFLDYIDSIVDEIYVDDVDNKEKFNEMILGLHGDELKHIKILESQRIFEDFNVENQLKMLLNRKVELSNGGSIVIDVTEALTAIDVNSGSYVGSRNMEETALAINLDALEEIARQVRLRNLSGIIIIDFINVKKEESISRIMAKARSLFKNDKAKVDVLGMTKLNLMEITRKRDKENFYNLMTEECSCCHGSGKTSSKIFILIKIEGIIKNIKLNTSSEAVILNVGSILYNKILKDCMDDISQIEEKYCVKILIEKHENILNDDILIGKMGKLSVIKSITKT